MSDARALIYLDSNPIIYFLEGSPELTQTINPFFEKLRTSRGAAVTSEITLGEVLAPSAQSSWSLDIKRKAYLNLLVWSELIRLQPISREIIYETASLRSGSGLKLIDAIHVATALMSGCRFFFTADKRVPIPSSMTKLTPDKSGVARLIEAIP